MKLSGYEALTPTKGCHFPGMTYVEYEGVVPDDKRANLIKQLEEHCNELIKKDLPTVTTYVEPQDVETVCLKGPNCDGVNEFTRYDSNRARVVFVGSDKGCPCGGTHVTSTKIIGKVTIRKITVKKGITK